MSPHPHLIALIAIAALGLAAPASAQTPSSQSMTPQAPQRLLQDPANPIQDVTRKYGGTLACPTCMPGEYGPLGTEGTIPLIRPGQFDKFVEDEQKRTSPPPPTLIACAPVPLKVGPSKIGVINGSDQTLTFSVKLGAAEQIVKLAPGEIETVSVPVGRAAVAGTSDNRIPAQTLTGGTVYRLKAQNGKWAFVVD